MLANFFEKTKPVNSIVLLLLFLSIYFVQKIMGSPTFDAETFWLYELFFFGGLLLFMAISGTYFIRNLFTHENLFPSLLLILSFAFFPETLQSNIYLLVAMTAFLIFKKLTQLKEHQRAELLLFDCGLFVGMGFLILDWSVLLLLFVYFAIFFSEKYSYKNFLVPIVGFIVPVFLSFTYLFLTDNLNAFYRFFEFNTAESSLFLLFSNRLPVVFSFGLFAFISVVIGVPKALGISNEYRYEHIVTLMLFLSSIGILTLSADKEPAQIVLLFIPTAIYTNQFFYSLQNKTAKDILLGIYAFCSLYCLVVYA